MTSQETAYFSKGKYSVFVLRAGEGPRSENWLSPRSLCKVKQAVFRSASGATDDKTRYSSAGGPVSIYMHSTS